MKPSIDMIREVTAQATHHWRDILGYLGIDVPERPRDHSACPACGGKDRFRFDDQDGRGTHFCNQCGAGDGLELVQKVKQCTSTEAAIMVADALGMALNSPMPVSTKPVKQPAQPDIPIANKVAELVAKTVSGESHYLLNKGLPSPSQALLSDGSLLLVLQTMEGVITGAQVIKPDGTKRLISGTIKKGSFIPVRLPPISSNEPVVTVLIAEGNATGVTVSLLSDGAVLAAIDEGNLIHIAKTSRERWPDAKIIIAADNDLKPGEKNVGKESAEKAATAVNGWVALPPTDHKADWDDYRQQYGLDASITAFADSLYQPHILAEEEPPVAEPQDVRRPYVDERKGGMYWVEPKLDKSNGNITERESWLSDPISVSGIGEDDNERYLILSWTPEGNSTERSEALPMRDIGEREGWSRLRAGGLSITAKSGLRAILADYLQRSGERQLWTVANATGWQCGAYIMPDGSVIGAPATPVLFNGRSSAAKGYITKGTPESWRNNVAKLARGNPSMMLGIACAFAAPLIGLAGADGFGVHLFGGSSAGKTTTGNAATTVYGEPEALKLTWYSTALGLVNEAAAHNDGFMPLDEIGQGSNKRAVADAAYALFNGVGKIQGAKEGGNRDVKRWRAMAFSTGEIDLESYIRADGGKVNAGQLVRLLNVPITKATVYHGFKDGKAHADAMRDACKDHYGAVGRAWIKCLASQKEVAAQAVRDAERRWIALLPDEASEQVRRVASRFAILEAALLLSKHLTSWNEQECRDALQHGFNAWVNDFGMGNRESKAWAEQAESFLQRFGYSRYLPHPETDPRDLPIKDLAGYREKKQGLDTLVFHTFPSVFRDEIAVGANAVAFAQVLADAGMLDKPSKGITKKTLRIDGKQPRFVVLMMPDDLEE
ncbi:DNA primase [Yersinia kristensenii]|nr:DNA primase [Yersinia kristensenii]